MEMIKCFCGIKDETDLIAVVMSRPIKRDYRVTYDRYRISKKGKYYMASYYVRYWIND